jgi:hypothetical protein
MDYGSVLNQAFMRFAGGTPLPGELDKLRNLILQGRIQDDEGNSITVTPQGSFEITPVDSSLSVRGSYGYDPSIELRYQSKRPVMFGRTPKSAVDEALKDLAQTY